MRPHRILETGKYHQSHFHDLSPDYDGKCRIGRCFFANLKRRVSFDPDCGGQSLFIQCAEGILIRVYGYANRHWSVNWTAFLQATVLIAGLMVVKDQALLSLGLMLSAGEIPRIAGQFGLETGTKATAMEWSMQYRELSI